MIVNAVYLCLFVKCVASSKEDVGLGNIKFVSPPKINKTH